MASTTFITGTVISSTWLNTVDMEVQAEIVIPSASSIPLASQTANKIQITGTTTITSFGPSTGMNAIFIRFTGILTLTHNSTSLICPGNTNITTAAGDCCILVPITGGWQVYNYQRQATSP